MVESLSELELTGDVPRSEAGHIWGAGTRLCCSVEENWEFYPDFEEKACEAIRAICVVKHPLTDTGK
jgi:hypothetical protein